MLADPSLAGWDGFGLAMQAYQKRAPRRDRLCRALAERYDRRLMVRLVKGAYWDTEIKRAQERGLDDYPVFTRKAMTDLNYLACARRLLALRPRIFPQFATHNALTVATILERAGGAAATNSSACTAWARRSMRSLRKDHPEIACRIYAPVGSHRDLLAYLVRRLLENGANSPSSSVAADPAVPVERCCSVRPTSSATPSRRAHPQHSAAARSLRPRARNSRGVEFGDRAALRHCWRDEVAPSRRREPLIDGSASPARRATC